MKKPLVSVCIPTHNRPELFKRALQSALRQTYKHIEVIVSDNSDNSLTEKYIRTIKDKRISYYKDSSRSTSFQNINNVALLAKGVYIKYLLDDDLLENTCVEKMASVLDTYPRVGIVMAPLDIIDMQDKSINPVFYFFRKMRHLYKYKNKSTLVDKKQILNDFLTSVYPCCVPTGIMFRKSLFEKVKGFDKRFAYIGDVELCMNFATKMDFYYIDQYLASWRYSNTSETVSVLHKKGIALDIFYKLTQKYIKYASSPQNAYFFASKRTAINILAGIQSNNLNLIVETVKTILYNDPYSLNKIKLPFNLLYEVIRSLFL